jgi:hypothetical protein
MSSFVNMGGTGAFVYKIEVPQMLDERNRLPKDGMTIWPMNTAKRELSLARTGKAIP